MNMGAHGGNSSPLPQFTTATTASFVHLGRLTGQMRLHRKKQYQHAPGVCGMALVLFIMVAGLPAHANGRCPAPADNSGMPRWHGQFVWQALSAHDYVIGEVNISVMPIYDTNKKDHDVWYAHLVNNLHVNTRPQTIRNNLLFQPGQPINPATIYQTARHLRSVRFLQYVSISPARCHDGQVDIDISVRDSWSLKPQVSFSRVGGRNIVKFELEDDNFLGFGKTLAVGRLHSITNAQNYIKYIDPNLGGSRWQLHTRLADQRGGHSHSLSVRRPFFSNTTSWAAGGRMFDQNAHLYFSNRGTRAWVVANNTRQLNLSWHHLIRWNGTAGWRMGMRYIDESYRYGTPLPLSPTLRPKPAPADRDLVGIELETSYFQSHYATFRNLRLIDRSEDYNLGWTASASLGKLSTYIGSSINAWTTTMDASWGTKLALHNAFFFNAHARGRYSHNQWRASEFNTNATLYNQSLPNQTVVIHAQGKWQWHPDPENQLYIGGASGLRGYHTFFRTGDRRWQVTIEDRILTSTLFMDTFRIGYAVYLDAAQIHKLDGSGWSRTFTNIGAGLRVGNTRFSFANVVYVTIAVPLVRSPGVPPYEIMLGNILRF